MKKAIIIFFLFGITFSNAQFKSEPEIFTLEQCIETALRYNYDIQLYSAQMRSNTADVTAAFGDFLPSLNFYMGYNRQLNSQGVKTLNIGGQNIPIQATDPNSYSMSASAAYIIFNGFSNVANYKRAQESFNAQYLTLNQTQNKVKLDVYRQFIDVIRKSQIIKIRQSNLELGQKELEHIQAQVDAGTKPITFLYTQQAELGNREYELVISENDFNISKTTLLYTMGLNTANQVEFSESSLPTNIDSNDVQQFRLNIGGFNGALNTALQSRIDISATKSSITAAESNITIAESGYFPTLAASGGWSWSNSQLANFGDNGRTYVGLQLSVPIFDNFNSNLRIQNAKVQLKQKELELNQVEQNIRTNVKTAMQSIDASEKQLNITKRALFAAEQNYESMSERFRVGSSSLTDLLSANNQLITAQINRINSIYYYFQIQKEMLYAIGKL